MGLRVPSPDVITVMKAISNFNKMVEAKPNDNGLLKRKKRKEEGQKSNSVNYFLHNLLVKPHSLFENFNKLNHLVMVELTTQIPRAVQNCGRA